MRFFWSLLSLAAPLTAAPSLAAIRADLIKWEGYKTTPYRDGAAWSVGVGHNLTAHRELVKSRYTPHEVERFLLRDIAWVLDVCRAGIRDFDELPDNVQLVAISVAFTSGRAGFMKHVNLRRALSWRAFNAAATELGTSKWFKQVGAARANWALRTLRQQP